MTSQTPFISIPCKITDEIDWIKPLRKYILDFYQDDPDNYLEELNTLQRLRQDVRGAGPDFTGRDILYRYFGQLEFLDVRFPVDETHIKINFTWYDIFNIKPTSQTSLAFEKACVIFNIASVLSAIASSQNLQEEEELRKAYNYFQASAGTFSYINENFLHAPSSDLNRENVKIFSSLMLAQAQECFIQKSYFEKKSDHLIARTTTQASWMYNNLYENINEPAVKSLFPKSWLLLCQLKSKYYFALAQFHKALSCEQEGKYGEIVSRTQVAETYAKEAVKLANSFTHSLSSLSISSLSTDAGTVMQDLTKTLYAKISEKFKSSTKDNDTIYHDQVPLFETLPVIDKYNTAKSLNISEIYTSGELQKVLGPEIFQRLIPMSVHQSSSLYSEEKAKIVRQETEQVETANTEIEAAFTFLQLPGSLQRFKNRDRSRTSILQLAQPPPKISVYAKTIYEEEEVKGSLADLFSTIKSLREKIKDNLDSIGYKLDEEQRECESKRVRYSESWRQESSSGLTKSFRKDLKTHRDNIEKSYISDCSLQSKYDQVKALVLILRKGPNSDQINQLFLDSIAESISKMADLRQTSKKPNLLDDVDPPHERNIDEEILNIEECVDKLNYLKKGRLSILNDLKKKVQEDDISHLLVLNRKNNNIEPQIFASELEKFKPYQTKIADSVKRQQPLIQELSEHFKALMESPEARDIQSIWDSAEMKRDTLLDSLKRAHDTYIQVKNGIKQGIQFYVDLTELVDSLLKNVEVFCRRRREEREALISSIETEKSERDHIALKERLNKVNSPPQGEKSIDHIQYKTSQLSLDTNSSETSKHEESKIAPANQPLYAQLTENTAVQNTEPMYSPNYPPKPKNNTTTSPSITTIMDRSNVSPIYQQPQVHNPHPIYNYTSISDIANPNSYQPAPYQPLFQDNEMKTSHALHQTQSPSQQPIMSPAFQNMPHQYQSPVPINGGIQRTSTFPQYNPSYPSPQFNQQAPQYHPQQYAQQNNYTQPPPHQQPFNAQSLYQYQHHYQSPVNFANHGLPQFPHAHTGSPQNYINTMQPHYTTPVIDYSKGNPGTLPHGPNPPNPGNGPYYALNNSGQQLPNYPAGQNFSPQYQQRSTVDQIPQYQRNTSDQVPHYQRTTPDQAVLYQRTTPDQAPFYPRTTPDQALHFQRTTPDQAHHYQRSNDPNGNYHRINLDQNSAPNIHQFHPMHHGQHQPQPQPQPQHPAHLPPPILPQHQQAFHNQYQYPNQVNPSDYNQRPQIPPHYQQNHAASAGSLMD